MAKAIQNGPILSRADIEKQEKDRVSDHHRRLPRLLARPINWVLNTDSLQWRVGEGAHMKARRFSPCG